MEWYARLKSVPTGLHIENWSNSSGVPKLWGITSRAFSNWHPTQGRVREGFDGRNVVGGAFHAHTAAESCSAFGIATEAWSHHSPEAGTGHLLNEVSIISQHARASWTRKRGLDVVFKNRPDSRRYGAIASDVDANCFNAHANALVVTSQARSGSGEYCGWNAVIRLGPHALDISALQPFTAIVDMRSCSRDNDNKIPYRYVWRHEGATYGELYNYTTGYHEVWKHIDGDRKLIKSW